MRSPRNHASSPSLRIPAVSASIARLMSLKPMEEDYFDAVLSVVSTDPGLGTRLLGMANSAFLSSKDSTLDPCRALMRVGPRRFTSVVVGGAISELFHTSSPELEHLLLHSKAVAALSRRVAAQFPQFDLDPDVARTLGLLHNIGALVLASGSPEAYTRILRRHNLDSRAILLAEREELGVDHVRAGTEVAERWALPALFRTVIQEHHTPRGEERAGAGAELDVTCLSLRLQRVLACGRGDEVGRAVALRSVAHEARRLQLDLDEGRTRMLLEGALDDLVEDLRAHGTNERAAG